MDNHQIFKVIQECADILNVKIGSESFQDDLIREYDNAELVEFVRDMVESSSNSGMIMLEKHLVESRFKELMKAHASPVTGLLY